MYGGSSSVPLRTMGQPARANSRAATVRECRCAFGALRMINAQPRTNRNVRPTEAAILQWGRTFLSGPDRIFDEAILPFGTSPQAHESVSCV